MVTLWAPEKWRSAGAGGKHMTRSGLPLPVMGQHTLKSSACALAVLCTKMSRRFSQTSYSKTTPEWPLLAGVPTLPGWAARQDLMLKMLSHWTQEAGIAPQDTRQWERHARCYCPDASTKCPSKLCAGASPPTGFFDLHQVFHKFWNLKISFCIYVSFQNLWVTTPLR